MCWNSVNLYVLRNIDFNEKPASKKDNIFSYLPYLGMIVEHFPINFIEFRIKLRVNGRFKYEFSVQIIV